MIISTVSVHLERLVGAKGKVGAPLFLPPVVCHEGVTDYVWFGEAGVEMEGYFVVSVAEEIDLKPRWGRKAH